MKRDRNGTKKPLDFAKLDKAHKAWKAAGGDRSNPRAGEVGRMAAHYLDWAEQQPACGKRTKRCERARQMLAAAGGTPRPSPSSPRSEPPSPTGTISRSSAPSILSPLLHIKNAVAAGAKQFEAALNEPRAGSFEELQRAYERLPSVDGDRPLDSIEASRVRQLAQDYLARLSHPVKEDTVQHQKRMLADRYVTILDVRIEKERLCAQRGIEAQRQLRFSPHLKQRTEARQKHAQALVSQSPRLNRTSGGTSDRLIRGDDDDDTVYRFVPLPTRQANAGRDLGPQHAVFASILHRKLEEQTGLDLRFPCATNATLEGVTGVLIDEVNLPSPDAGRVPTVKERQRAALAQWVLGRPSATWRDIGIDALGQTFVRELPQGTPDLLAMATAALGEGPPLPGLQDRATDGPVQGTDEVLDEDLANRLRRVDIHALARSLAVSRDAVDVTNALNGVRTGQPVQHFASSHGGAVERLLEPLGALQRALDIDPDVPLTTLLRNAAEELLYRHAPHADTRSPVTPVTRAEPRGLAARVKRGLWTLWHRLRPWKSTADGRHQDRTTAVPPRASSPAGTPLAR